MSNLTPPVIAPMLCSHSALESCASTADGHAVSVLRERVTAATPSKWRDGLVVHAASGNWIGIALLDSSDTVWVWNHSDLGAAVSIGEPVALHDLYDTLAIGASRVSVLRAPH